MSIKNKMNRTLAILLSIILVIGFLPTLAFADVATNSVTINFSVFDGRAETPYFAVTNRSITVSEPKPTYDVTVKAAPSTANVVFYNCDGFDTNGYDIPGTPITAVDKGVTDSYHIYTFTSTEGTVSFRGTDAEGKSLGGMTFDVPPVINVDGTSTGDCEIVLRQMDTYTTTKYDGTNYCTENEYSTRVYDADGSIATVGIPYKSGNYTRFPYLLYANGNAELYSVQLIPSETIGKDYNLGTLTLGNYAHSTGTTIQAKSGALPTLINAVINAPADAEVKVFNQVRNFCNEEIPQTSQTEAADGTVDHIFRLPKSNGNHTYRASMAGKLTKAGYMNLSSEDKAKTTITFAADENPQIRTQYDITTTIGKRLEDSILLNINTQNYLRLDKDEEFKVRAYRAWQIINSDTGNIMIEPDFHYNIISGDSITLTQQGQNAVIKGVKNGISLVEVTYDAIEIGGNTSYTGVYGAIDPNRKGLFAVNVGGDTRTVINMTSWDSEMDTVYFLGESGEFKFKPTSSNAMTVACEGVEISTNSDGSYTLPIKQGNNVVTVTAGDTTEYQIIKGNKLTAHIENLTSPETPIKQGNKVGISFEGLHMPMPKFSGIYNPGYMGTMKIGYNTSDGGNLTSKGTQYDFINNHQITFTAYEKGILKLSDGYIPMTSTGSPRGAHRELTDSGMGANFNAVSVAAEFSQLPEVEIEVEKNNDLSYLTDAQSSYCNLANVNIICGTDTFTRSFSISKTTEKAASVNNVNATFSSINAVYPLKVTATAVNSGVDMEFRYWEEGDNEKTTVALPSGTELNIGTGIFSGEKTINMEIAVMPKNAIYGGGRVYSYVVYKASLARPVLKTLKIKDGDGNALSLPYGTLYSDNGEGISYTNTNYYCYVPSDATLVTIETARLNGTSDITIGSETKSIGTTATSFTPIALAGDETEVKLTVADGRTYTIKLIKRNGVFVDRMVNNGEIAALTINSTQSKSLNVFLASYDKNEMKKISKTSVVIEPGTQYIFIDFSSMMSYENVKMFVWDENLKPYTTKDIIIK